MKLSTSGKPIEVLLLQSLFTTRKVIIPAMYLDEFPAGFLPNILMGEEISAIKFLGTWNGKKVLRFRALAWTYQTDQLKAKIFGLMLNAIGSDIEGIEWRGGESLAVGDGNELAQRLDELLKKDVPDIEPEDEFDF